MKVDGLGVILSIILLPIILVVTYYIQMQVDTIAKENSYNTSLLNATYDAMSAFEINTANEELSSVADSMRSLVMASNNIFFNTLATNLGISNASKEYLQPYIPAVLYTMYDGYYIYSPTEIPQVAEKQKETDTDDSDEESELTVTEGYHFFGDTSDDIDENQVEGHENAVYGDVLYTYDGEKNSGTYEYTVNPDNAKKKDDYVLKSYVQYSANYSGYKGENNSGDEVNVTINYTLDNYLNIVGTIGDIYYTKTGYLIKDGLVQNLIINGDSTTYSLITNWNEDDLKNKILGKKTNSYYTTIPAAKEVSILVNGKEIKANWDVIVQALNEDDENSPLDYYKTNSDDEPNILTISDAESYLERALDEGKDLTKIQNLKYEIQKYKAIAYYASSAAFSNWVYDNLGNLRYENIQDESMRTSATSKYESKLGETELFYNFENNGTKIFDRDNDDPEDSESKFNVHKMEVIKNSIKYNLNLSMSAYSNKYTTYEANLPVLLDEEWDKILSNISIVAFMQGWDCGLDIYNNYEMVSSTNNELTVTPSEIYYVPKGEFNGQNAYYHRIDCPDLAETDDNNEYISFKSKEVKYDKIYNKPTGKYKYDHRNLACYKCINTNNYDSLFIRPNSTGYYDRIQSLNKSDIPTNYGEDGDGDSVAKKIAGYIGIANERQSIYKTNALPVSQGYKIFETTSPFTNGNATCNVPINLSDVKELQITFSNTKSNLGTDTNVNRENVLVLSLFEKNNPTKIVNLSLDQKNAQTVSVDVNDRTDNLTSISFYKQSPNYNVSYKVESIKAIYK